MELELRDDDFQVKSQDGDYQIVVCGTGKSTRIWLRRRDGDFQYQGVEIFKTARLKKIYNQLRKRISKKNK